MLKTSEFSLVLRTRKNSDVFNSRAEIYLVFTEKKVYFLLTYTCYRLHALSHPLKDGVLKMQKHKILANPNIFGTKVFFTF